MSFSTCIYIDMVCVLCVCVCVCLWCTCTCTSADLENYKSEREGVDDGPVIPLLLQNKPPVTADEAENSEIPDLSLRPESVSGNYSPLPLINPQLGRPIPFRTAP